MSIEYRRARPDEMAACVNLGNLVFGDDFPDLIPWAYAPGCEMRAAHFCAFDGGVPVAQCAVLPGELIAGGDALPYGYVGTVCVHQAYRGEGHMRRVMELAVAHMRETGCALGLLNGNRQRYEHFGFAPGGAEVRFQISEPNLSHALAAADASKVAFRPMTPADALEAHRLFERQAFHALRTPQSFLPCLNAFNCEPMTILLDGRIVGYAAGGRRRRVIEELCLSDMGLLKAVLKAWSAWFERSEFEICASPCDAPLVRALSAFAEYVSFGQNMHVSVYDWPRALKALLAAKRAVTPLPEGEMSFWAGDTPLTLTLRDGEISVALRAAEGARRMTETEAVNALFSMTAHLLLPEAPAGWLPLPMYLPAPDHF